MDFWNLQLSKVIIAHSFRLETSQSITILVQLFSHPHFTVVKDQQICMALEKFQLGTYNPCVFVLFPSRLDLFRNAANLV